ncbi:hypothetical protein LQZ21_04005 [Treponema sp. TIM-1]|uniref:beta strand repeat-containing protein n=1 Tax=Treponema sp. TIM-1 TaxID=2898417 RepID=UPI003980BF6D
MLKKYIIFGSVVLLMAALFTLTGCSQATDSDGGTTFLSENHLFGNADAAAIKAAVESAKATNRPVILTAGTTLIGPGATLPARTLATVASFGDVPVRVEGSVWVENNIIVNAAFASLVFDDGATITVRDGGAFIYTAEDNRILTEGANGYKVKYMTDPLMAVQGTDERIAIPSYNLGADFSDVAPHVTHLYVVDKVTLGATSDAGIPEIIPLGEVDLTGNVDIFASSLAGIQFTATAVLTSSVPGNVTIDLPDEAVLPTIKAATPITIAIPDAITNFTIAKVEGPDTLTISNTGTTPSIAALRIDEVIDSGKVVVNTPTLEDGATSPLEYGLFIAKNNAGVITLNTTDTAGITGHLVAENNTGTININTRDFNGTDARLDIPRPAGFPDNVAPYILPGTGTNSGTIAINADDFTGEVEIATANSGTVTITTPAIGAAVTIASNSGTVNFVTDNLTAAAEITTNTNTGTVNFTKGLIDPTLAANFIVSPANNGAINFWGPLEATATLGASTSLIGGSGTVTFAGEATFNAATTIGCNTEFKAGVIADISTGNLTLGGNVTLAHGEDITLTSGNLILGAGKQILVGANPVLAAGGNGVTIAAAGATLAAGPARTSDADDTYTADKTLTLRTQPITAITGELKVLGGGYFSLLNQNITLGAAGRLTLEDGAVLDLADGLDTAISTINIGDTTIAAGAAANDAAVLTASAGPVTLANNSISGSGTLAVPEDGGDPVITVGDSSSGGKTLTISGANLDLQNSGSLVIVGHGASGLGTNKVRLEGRGGQPSAGKITLSEETSATVTSGLSNRTIASNGTIRGSGVLRAGGETSTVQVGDIAGGDIASLDIHGPLATYSTTIDNAATVVLP